MDGRILPPVAVVIGFIDCVNRGDIVGLSRLMSEDHELQVFEEAPLTGREANTAGWQGYATAYPDYVIYPHRIAGQGTRVAVLGHTTGSHLGLPDDQERAVTLIWLADVADGALRLWRLLPDTPENRQELGLANADLRLP
jgi:hypothetical protein